MRQVLLDGDVVVVAGAFRTAVDDACFLQNIEVMRNSGTGEMCVFRDLVDAGAFFTRRDEEQEDALSGLIADGLEKLRIVYYLYSVR